jgi:hypothetical protein
LFRTGSAPGIYPSELSPSGRYPARFRVEEPTYRFACQYTCTEGTGRLGKPRFLGFNPSGSPWRSNVLLTRQSLDAPLGFSLLGLPRTPWPGFRPASSHALSRSGLFTRAAAPQSIDQRPLRLDLPYGKPQGSIRAPFLGFCTGLNPQHANAHPPGLSCSPHAASHITADCRRSLDGLASYRSCLDRLRCRAFARPFRILFPVARDRVTAGRCYPLPDLSSGNASRRLVSSGWLQPPSATNKPVKPVRHSSAGVQAVLEDDIDDRLSLLSTDRIPTARLNSS